MIIIQCLYSSSKKVAFARCFTQNKNSLQNKGPSILRTTENFHGNKRWPIRPEAVISVLSMFILTGPQAELCLLSFLFLISPPGHDWSKYQTDGWVNGRGAWLFFFFCSFSTSSVVGAIRLNSEFDHWPVLLSFCLSHLKSIGVFSTAWVNSVL